MARVTVRGRRRLNVVDSVEDNRRAALHMLGKVRRFVTEDLDEHERKMFAALVGPGVIAAYATDDVTGFAADWGGSVLTDALAQAITEEGLRVEGLEP